MYQCSNAERAFIGVRLARYRDAVGEVKRHEADVMEAVQLLREQQGLPASASYDEASGSFVVTPEATPAT